MKKLKEIIFTGLLSLMVWSVSGRLYAQQKLSEGKIEVNFVTNAFSMDVGEKKNGDMVLEFKDNHCKIISTDNSEAKITVIKNVATENLLVLTSGMGVNLAITVDSPDEFLEFAKQRASKDQLNKLEKLKELNKQLGEFKATGQRDSIDGRLAEKYEAKLLNGETVSIWTSAEVSLPADITKYPIGAIATLLQGKVIKGTLLKLVYGDKINVSIKLRNAQVAPISMDAPEGYQVYDIGEILSLGGG